MNKTLKQFSDEITKWREEKGFVTEWENMPAKLLLTISELTEAMEGYRRNNKENFNEEIADTFIRLFDICGSLNIDIEKEIEKKMIVNRIRPKIHGMQYNDKEFIKEE